MNTLLSSLDFLPQELGSGLRLFVYVLILLHLGALIFWLVITCPTMFKTKDTLKEVLERKDK